MSMVARRLTSSFDSAGGTDDHTQLIVFRLKDRIPRSPIHSSRRRPGRQYRPGDTIRQSGIYEVLHELQHREIHEAVMISGEKFPDCETCKDKVRFLLVRTAPYIFQDQDFGDEPA